MKIVILSVSAGAGHIRAAESLKVTAEAQGIEAVHIDLMDLVPKLFKKIYAESYIGLVENQPELWGYLYNKADGNKNSLLRDFIQKIERLNTRKIFDVLEKENADQIICTHFLPPQLLSRAISKGKFTTPVWVQVTDFDIHSLWVHENMQGYFTASAEVAWRLQDRGIPENQIHVTGIPIMPVFQNKFSRPEVLGELNLKTKIPTLLLMAGGAGVGDMDQLAQKILEMNLDLQIICLAGRNQQLLKKLDALSSMHQGKMITMGYTTEIEKFMTVSDFAVTKPGGLTTSECLTTGLPMIIISPIPGQEERNSDYLLENSVALKAYDSAGLEYKVRKLVNDPKMLLAMSKKAKAISTGNAAKDVLNIIKNSTHG